MAKVYFEVSYKSFECDCGRVTEFITGFSGLPESLTCGCGRAWKWLTPELVTEFEPQPDGYRCMECGEPAAQARVVCEKCLERKREANRREYERLKAVFEPGGTKKP